MKSSCPYKETSKIEVWNEYEKFKVLQGKYREEWNMPKSEWPQDRKYREKVLGSTNKEMTSRRKTDL